MRVDDGFLEVYHGVFKSDPHERIGTYCAAALLLLSLALVAISAARFRKDLE